MCPSDADAQLRFLAAAAVIDGIAASLHTFAADEAGAQVDCIMSASAAITISEFDLRMSPPPLMPKKVLFFGSHSTFCSSFWRKCKYDHRASLESGVKLTGVLGEGLLASIGAAD